MQFQFSAGSACFLFEEQPDFLKFLDQFLIHQVGISERWAFIDYLNRASLVEHLLREYDLFKGYLVPPPASATWDLDRDNF